MQSLRKEFFKLKPIFSTQILKQTQPFAIRSSFSSQFFHSSGKIIPYSRKENALTLYSKKRNFATWSQQPQQEQEENIGKPPLSYLLKSIVFSGAIIGGSYYVAYSDEVTQWKNKTLAQYQLMRAKGIREQNPLTYWWWSLPISSQITLGLIILPNVVVFSLWKLSQNSLILRRKMYQWFTHSPFNHRASAGLFSCFSHSTFFHILFNMTALWSFSGAVIHTMGPQQFLAMFVGAGVFSSAARDVASSLGASGAIWGMLASLAFLYPDMKLAIVFLPMITFTASTALPFLIGFDTIGALLGAFGIYKSKLDHVAHLGGALFGYFWTRYWLDKEKEKLRRRISSLSSDQK